MKRRNDAWRRWLFFTLTLVSTLIGSALMFDILRSNDFTVLEATILLLFTVTFGWIVMAFWSAVFGFILQLLRLDPISLKRLSGQRNLQHAIDTRTALIMPVYNEDTRRIMAGFEATLRDLAAHHDLAPFDFYMLSDTQNVKLAAAELSAWHAMMEGLGDLAKHAFYRRRHKNRERKTGNIKEFCERWGSKYDFMLVLDADSVLSADCVLQLVRQMQAQPQAGLMQTVPIPVRQATFFGRFVQFASVLYSPMLATGQAFWQTDTANYWGHNAIIRVRAFMAHCGLPTLPGKAPLGGDILSHDFVEAAMLKRAGWDVYLLADIAGSYEEVPSNMLDYATRDRRWVQGNIQHLGLLFKRGWQAISRVHFVAGATAYIASLLWLLMLVFSTIDAVLRSVNSNQYFSHSYQLFPNWPVAKTEQMFVLIGVTAVLLLLPKVLSLVVTILYRRREFGGALRLTISALIETTFAIVIAPIMMVFHAYFVLAVVFGLSVNWESQSREGRLVSWREAFSRTLLTSIAAALWGWLTYSLASVFFWWLTPILFGLVLAAPIVRYSSSLSLGSGLRRMGLLLVPSELSVAATAADNEVLTELQQLLEHQQEPALSLTVPAVPPNQFAPMPTQSFGQLPSVDSQARG